MNVNLVIETAGANLNDPQRWFAIRWAVHTVPTYSFN